MAVVDKPSADAAYIAGLTYESDATGATAQQFLAAVRYYLGFQSQSYNIAGRSLTRMDLLKQADAASTFVRNSPANNARVNMFTRGRTLGLGI